MTYKPTRRTRGPNKPKAAEPAAPLSQPPLREVPESTAEQADPPSEQPKRRRRSSVGGHAMKLTAPSRPGFQRRWFNDDKNRLAEADELGYDHVTEKGIKSSGPGSRVSRLVGTKASGEPLRAFLMETPDELYAQGLAEKEGVCAEIDNAIKAGRDSTGQMPSQETYGHGSIKVG